MLILIAARFPESGDAVYGTQFFFLCKMSGIDTLLLDVHIGAFTDPALSEHHDLVGLSCQTVPVSQIPHPFFRKEPEGAKIHALCPQKVFKTGITEAPILLDDGKLPILKTLIKVQKPLLHLADKALQLLR